MLLHSLCPRLGWLKCWYQREMSLVETFRCCMMLPVVKHSEDVLAAWAGQVGVAALVESLLALDPAAAVFAVDAERQVVLWSPGAERLLGLEPLMVYQKPVQSEAFLDKLKATPIEDYVDLAPVCRVTKSYDKAVAKLHKAL